jgi:hypothetical protein
MERFGDFVDNDERPFSGDKVRLNDLINKEIILLRYKIRPSKYKDKGDRCATVQFKYDESGEEKIFFTGSSVIIDQLEKYGEKLPFMTVIKHIDKYYTLS